MKTVTLVLTIGCLLLGAARAAKLGDTCTPPTTTPAPTTTAATTTGGGAKTTPAAPSTAAPTGPNGTGAPDGDSTTTTTAPLAPIASGNDSSTTGTPDPNGRKRRAAGADGCAVDNSHCSAESSTCECITNFKEVNGTYCEASGSGHTVVPRSVAVAMTFVVTWLLWFL